MNDTPLFSLYEIAYVYCFSRRIGHLSACFPCHGKTRVNGGQNGQKTLNESVTFTSTGTPTIHKKAKKKGKPFLIIFLSSSSWKKQKCLTFG